LCELCGIFTGKIFKIYFSNAFSTENYYLNHSTSAKFFSYLVQELQDSRQAFPPTIYVVAPLPKSPYITVQIRASNWNLSRVTTCPDHRTRRGYPTCHGSDAPSWESARNREIHVGVRREDTSVLPQKQAFLRFPAPQAQSNVRSPVQKGILAHFFKPDLCQNQSNGRYFRDIIKQRTWFFANKTWFGQSRPSPVGDSTTKK